MYSVDGNREFRSNLSDEFRLNFQEYMEKKAARRLASPPAPAPPDSPAV
jgi:hypothetical protein